MGKGMEEGGKEGSWHQEQIENDLLCFFSFFLVRVCVCAHINPAISQVVIIFLCGCLRGCERVQPCILH